ncbi:pyrroline-5-carboxylate reductase-like [Hibiscus syriacus]|uniref:pyrroline-5-carboxylate reductase-like n=1 Tax=Hibiscus syriacus TaxID=106335 RepID=UPI001920D316|nr:pyrroline-5-carboxylate reductase-like [Hibiscus syriacus]
MSLGGSATEQDGVLVGKLFGSVGMIWKADEKLFDAVLGAASMAVQSGKHPGQLKDDVTSPGGTTIAGIHELEKNGFRGTLMNAVVAAAKRSQELSQELKRLRPIKIKHVS